MGFALTQDFGNAISLPAVRVDHFHPSAAISDLGCVPFDFDGDRVSSGSRNRIPDLDS